MTARKITYVDAIREAQAELLATNPDVLVLGLGVPGPTGVFGSCTGLQERFGADRVLDMPSSENAMTGVALGAATRGKRPIMVHMRVDFAVLSMEPLVNQAAKWSYMYGGVMRAPLTIRMIIGRGWGQGPQHSQSLQAWFGHIPGLKVVMPSRAADAKGMLISAVTDDAPVIIFEHRWLYGLTGEVEPGLAARALEGAEILRPGRDVTIAATSHMVVESLRAADLLAEIGVEAEVIDLRCLTPIDGDTLSTSLQKTGRLIVADTGHAQFGVAAEVISVAARRAFTSLKAAPRVAALAPAPTPTTPALADLYYPFARDIAEEARQAAGCELELPPEPSNPRRWRDTPDPSFTGPY